MSVHDCSQPTCSKPESSSIEHIIKPVEKDLGGFSVARVLPSVQHRRVGPFIFFDHLGPSSFAKGTGMDVRPHPHIGLSTLTYLFTGEIMHRDSLGYVQSIKPGAVNWMTAGSGIVHSERTPDALRKTGFEMHGLQIWIALPDGQEEVMPSFNHHPAGTLPKIQRGRVHMTLVAGEAFGQRSPVLIYSPLFYLDVCATEGEEIPIPTGYAERALYLVDGEILVDDAVVGPRRMVVLTAESEPTIRVMKDCRLMLLGGAPLASDRTVWWNFSSSSKARLELAKEVWRNGRFDPVPGETEFIPLPDN